jgi:hypothetical protein
MAQLLMEICLQRLEPVVVYANSTRLAALEGGTT